MSSYLVINDVEVWRNGTTAPPVVPTPVPVTPPPSVPPASGPVFAFPEGPLYPVAGARIDAPTAIPFISNTSIAPLGILIHFVNQEATPPVSLWNISMHANDMTQMFPFGSTTSSNTGVLVLRFGHGTSGGPDQNCLLPANTQLYLNLGSGSSQLWWERRTY